MVLKYLKINNENYEYVKRLMIDSYDDDALLHTGSEYFNNNEDEKFLKILKYEFKVVLKDDKIIGGYSFDINNKELISLFIDPLLQRFGYGKIVIEYILNKYGDDCKLSIPSYSKKSYDFFKNSGFIAVEENYFDDFIVMKYNSN